MVDRLRILLAEPNRYQALLIDRELVTRFPSAIIARFHRGSEALAELHRTSYDVAIVDADSLDCDPNELLFAARAGNSGVVILVLGSTATPDSAIAAAAKWADELVNHEERKPDELADLIESFADRWQEIAEPSGPLEARTRRAVISLTVSTLAHEINNPLMAILGTSELLLDSSTGRSDDIREKLRMIQSSAQRIQKTLTELTNIEEPVVESTAVGPLINSRASNGK